MEVDSTGLTGAVATCGITKHVACHIMYLLHVMAQRNEMAYTGTISDRW